MLIGGETTVAGLLASPEQIVHTISPAIHNAGFAAAGLDWAYVPFPVESGDVARAIDGLVAAGVQGLNITMPHKSEAMAATTLLTPEAEAIGAINTIAVKQGEVVGSNTDAPGFIRYVLDDLGAELAGREVLVFGAGGAARAVTYGLARQGCTSITICARDTAKADRLQTLVVEGCHFAVVGPEPEADLVRGCTLIVNASPLGQAGELVPIPTDELGASHLIVDLVYRPALTPLIKVARSAGASSHGGLGMLLRQAAISFETWTGSPAPMEAMSASAVRALGTPMRPGIQGR